MVNGKLLDTNAASAIIDKDPDMQSWLANDYDTLLPSIVVGELYFGAYKSTRVAANLALVEEFIAGNVVINCDAGTAKHYGQIKTQLKMKGRSLPENDIWIAAVALQHQLVVVTRDAHFTHVNGVQSESW